MIAKFITASSWDSFAFLFTNYPCLLVYTVVFIPLYCWFLFFGPLNLFPAIIVFLLLKKHIHVNELGVSGKNADGGVYYFIFF